MYKPLLFHEKARTPRGSGAGRPVETADRKAYDDEHVASSEGLQQSCHLALSISETGNLPLHCRTAGNTTPTLGMGFPGLGLELHEPHACGY